MIASTAQRPVSGTDPEAGRPPARRPRRAPGIGHPGRFLIPGGLLMIVVIVIPLLVALYISLLRLDEYTFRRWVHAPFIGLTNYVDAVRQSDLLHGVWVSASSALVATVVAVPIGILAALTTHNRFRGRAVIRSVYLIPYVLPAFVVGTMWRIILQPGGVANTALAHLGITGGLWLNGPKSYIALIAVQVWASWPLVYLLVLSGLQNIDPYLHEAAALDGATSSTKLRYVILPGLRGAITLGAVITLLHVINAFTLPYVMFGVPAPHDVEVLPVLTYTESFQNFEFGISAAMAVISLILILIPLLVYLRAVRLDVGEEGRTG
jgi:multiple sugar transport system permease protein